LKGCILAITYGSSCSGIESASLAWEPLGWQACWFAEIEPFPSAVLAHHWPHVPNLGDMTRIHQKVLWGNVAAPDILVAGTPCQAFSVAGLREGLDDDRGQLTLSYMRLCDANDFIRRRAGKPASVIVWENVPGVLSDKDNAFGCFLAGLAGEDAEIEPDARPATGKSNQHWRWDKKSSKHIPKWPVAGCVIGPKRTVAWRVLDAQYFGVAQRRRRVFVVASARAGFNPAAVLFEQDGMRRDTPPSREAREEITGAAGAGIECSVARSLRAQPNCTHRADSDNFVIDEQPFKVANTLTARMHKGINSTIDEGQTPIVCNGTQDPCVSETTAFSLGRNNGGENVLCESVSLRGRDGGATAELGGNICPALKASQGGGDKPHVLLGSIDYECNGYDETKPTGPLLKGSPTGGGKPGQGTPCIESQMRVRRLTPVECERLQGMPDNHTLIPWRGKPAEQCPDGPRYKAIGNSKAVPVVRWIGQRIEKQLKL
tara:strand:- start:5363 stop:6826 length:1464 start_codon:yes stop_codon:yes gene_type:complete